VCIDTDAYDKSHMRKHEAQPSEVAITACNAYNYERESGIICQRQIMDENEDRLFHIRALQANDRNWVAHFMDEHWGSTKLVSRGKSYYGHLLPGFTAELDNAPDDAPPAGLITYNIEDGECEILTINSLQPEMGIGTALIEHVKAVAAEAKCRRIWLIITNDNVEAFRFFQKLGMRLAALHVNALVDARKMKPQIPLVGKHGIPLHDEIELQIEL